MRIGYLGVGNMGQPMAGKLLDGGHELWVCDVREDAMRPLLERQARRAASPKELADACDTIVISLPTLKVFRQAIDGSDGLLAGKALKTIINTCTVGTPFITEIEQACAAAGVIVIDAPISGGPAGARDGTLAVMVSGNLAKVAELMPIFRLWGPTVVVAGDKPGPAQIMKLTNNILAAVALIATSEAMTMATKGGIPADAMLQVLNNGTGRNFGTTIVFPKTIIPRTFDFGATIEILMKDVDLAIEQGEALGVPMWVCQAARLVLKHGVFQGRAQQDMSRVVQIIEDGTRNAALVAGQADGTFQE
jgi:3-hydroxyisobutyrate dehydrogenase-like beta-hydroxyacid dehydrogenase